MKLHLIAGPYGYSPAGRFRLRHLFLTLPGPSKSPFLPTYKFITAISIMACNSTVFPILLVIGNQMSIDAVFFKISGIESSNGSMGPQLRCRKL